MKKEELTKTRQFAHLERFERAGVFVPLSWCAKFDLTPTELLLFCYIQRHTEKYVQKAYTGSVKGLCAIVNRAEPTVRRALEYLEESGFIAKKIQKREISGEKSVDWVTYVSLIPSSIPTNSAEIDELLEKNETTFNLLHKEFREKLKKERSERRKATTKKKKDK